MDVYGGSIMSAEKMTLRDQLWTTLYPRFFLNKTALSEALDAIMPLLASLQAPCPGKAGELAAAIREWRKRWDHRSDVAEHAIRKGNAPRRSGVQMRHADEVVLMLDMFLALLSAQPVPPEDQGSVAGEAESSSALPRQTDKGPATSSGGVK